MCTSASAQAPKCQARAIRTPSPAGVPRPPTPVSSHTPKLNNVSHPFPFQSPPGAAVAEQVRSLSDMPRSRIAAGPFLSLCCCRQVPCHSPCSRRGPMLPRDPESRGIVGGAVRSFWEENRLSSWAQLVNGPLGARTPLSKPAAGLLLPQPSCISVCNGALILALSSPRSRFPPSLHTLVSLHFPFVSLPLIRSFFCPLRRIS